MGLTKEQVLMVYATKHWDALQTYVREQASGGPQRALSEPISGRVHDMLVYMLLLLAMLQENGQ